MPGFFSWISAIFSPSRSAAMRSSPRLLNPTITQNQDEPSDRAPTHHLEEHLFCWLLDAPPSALDRELDSDAQAVLNILEQRINRQSLDELPRRPMTLPMLTRALADETTDRKELTKIILSDPALTDQLLHVANSPLFRPGDKPIESVDQAVFMLGMNGIRNVISAAVMRPMMAARNSREALFAQRVWRWGLTCAKAAEQVADLKKKTVASISWPASCRPCPTSLCGGNFYESAALPPSRQNLRQALFIRRFPGFNGLRLRYWPTSGICHRNIMPA